MFALRRKGTVIAEGLKIVGSGWCLFLGIVVLLLAQSHTSGRTTSMGVDQQDVMQLRKPHMFY